MMGKLSAWRGDRKDSFSHSDLGGLVSIDDLDAGFTTKLLKSQTPENMKKPKLSLGRLAPALGFSRSRDTTPSGLLSPTAPHDHGLFSNIPSISSSHGRKSFSSLYDDRPNLHSRRPSAVSDRAILHSPDPLRPKTADPTVSRRRSKTTPQSGSRYPAIMVTDEKPLPLVVDVDAKKKEAATKVPRKVDSGTHASSVKSPPRNQYNLVPTPSIRSSHSKQASQSSSLSRGLSVRSNMDAGQRQLWSPSQNATPRDTPRTSVHPSVRSSILDEVEGTLTATITELQGLQGNWHQEGPRAMSTSPFRPSSTGQQSIRSVRSSQDHGYFPVMPVQSHSPLPHSPMKPSPLTLGPDAPQNLQQVYNEQKKHSHAVLLENDALKRRLDALSKCLGEFEVEKASLSRTAKETQENLQIILTRLGEAKVAEQAAHNEFQAARDALEKERKRSAVLALELDTEKKRSRHVQGKLEEVNSQKVEMLERESEKQTEFMITRQNLQIVSEKLKNARREADSGAANDKSDTPSTIARMIFNLEDMQRQLHDRDAIIASLREKEEHTTRRTDRSEQKDEATIVELHNLQGNLDSLRRQLDASRKAPTSSQTGDLQTRLTRVEEELRNARVERDQFSAILHAEIRRTAVEEHGREHPSSAFLKNRIDLADAVEIARERARKYLGTTASSSHEPADLEKEIEYYLNDIVLYKLDVKGYKKDLRNARERIKVLSDHSGNNGS